MDNSERPIFADDNTIWGVCHSSNQGNNTVDYKLETVSKHKVVSLEWLMKQVYNPSIANQRRNKSKK